MSDALKNSIVVTSINAPTRAIQELSKLGKEWPLLVVGDNKTPPNWSQEGAKFISIEDQRSDSLRLARLLPENHYCRKNLGYLLAIASGATRIAETDDDNFPDPWDLPATTHFVEAPVITTQGWVNVYTLFTDEAVWPRGFPLNEILRGGRLEIERSAGPRKSSVQQFLASGDPDVDAIYRLTIGKTDHVYSSGSALLAKGAIVPFNSQSTVWFEEAFTYLYLPSFVSFRMTDIWRSFVAQVCLWAKDDHLAYHSVGVRQERNDHDLMKDFADEIVGYERNAEIMKSLQKLSLEGSAGENLMTCYSELNRIGVVPDRELPLVQAWLDDLELCFSQGKSH